MIFSNGFVYRWGQRIKEFGERIGCGQIISLGLLIRERVLGMSIEGLR